MHYTSLLNNCQYLLENYIYKFPLQFSHHFLQYSQYSILPLYFTQYNAAFYDSILSFNNNNLICSIYSFSTLNRVFPCPLNLSVSRNNIEIVTSEYLIHNPQKKILSYNTGSFPNISTTFSFNHLVPTHQIIPNHKTPGLLLLIHPLFY